MKQNKSFELNHPNEKVKKSEVMLHERYFVLKGKWEGDLVNFRKM